MKRIIIGISGASGAIYGIRALELLREMPDVETHAVVSPSAMATIGAETDLTRDDLKRLADVLHDFYDVGASLASGSYRTMGMLVAPCSIKTLSGIANSYCDSLMVRAADVCLKERRRLVLMVRETPLHAGHLDLMSRVTVAGGVIMPPVPAFYVKPASLEEMVTHTVARALDLFDIEVPGISRWKDG